MLKSISVKNFKSLKDVTVNIKPLTILLGPNCSGKSSLTQSLLLMQQTIEDRDEQAPLIFRGQYKDLGSYKDLLYFHDTDKNDLTLRITLSQSIDFLDLAPLFRMRLRPIDSALHQLIKRKGKTFTMDVKFAYDKARRNVYVNQLTYYNGENEMMFRVKPKKSPSSTDNTGIYVMEVPLSFKKALFTLSCKDCRIKNFFGFRKITSPHISTTLYKLLKNEKDLFFFRDKREEVEGYLEYMFSRTIYRITGKVYEFFADNICFLGPLRDRPRRFYIESGTIRRDVGFMGEWYPEILRAAERVEKTKRVDLKDIYGEVKNWLKKFDMASDIWTKDIESYQFLLRLRDKYTGIQASIADQGFGVSQVLPLIVQGFYAPPGTTLVVEQPEIHLHPKAQSTLADLLIQIMRNGVTLIVETHSDHIIEQIQSRIAEDKAYGKGDLRSQVGMYLFFRDKKEKCAKVYNDEELQLDQYGSLIDWPDWFVDGFLDGPYLKAKRMLAARMKPVEESKNG
ncbi:AAA family ATPase [candidate division WOR-3 bacterium]|nr:AAA family ATPase [candidate division WOR-3 bacterium]